MDWTTNPLVALYFATHETEKDPEGNPVDSAVYVLLQEPSKYSSLKAQRQNPQSSEPENPVPAKPETETKCQNGDIL